MWNRFKKANSKEIVKLEKTIDITELFSDAINLLISKDDYKDKKLKVIHIIVKMVFIIYIYVILRI